MLSTLAEESVASTMKGWYELFMVSCLYRLKIILYLVFQIIRVPHSIPHWGTPDFHPTRILCYFSLPYILFYACQIWGQNKSYITNRIFVLQKSAVRIMSFASFRSILFSKN